MAEFTDLIDQLTRLGVDDPLLSGATFDQAKEEYRRAYELELVKKGKVMLKQYAFLQQQIEEKQQEMASLKTQLNELDQHLAHTLVLDGGQKLEFDGEGGDVFKKFIQEKDEVLGGGLGKIERIEKEEGELSNDQSRDLSAELKARDELSEFSKSEPEGSSPSSKGVAIGSEAQARGMVMEEERSEQKDQLSNVEVDLGEIDLGDLDLGSDEGLQSGDMEPAVVDGKGEKEDNEDKELKEDTQDKLYDQKELEQESDALLDFL